MITGDDIRPIVEEAQIGVAADALDPAQALAEQGVDSLGLANLILHVEQAHDITASSADMANLRTLNDFADFVNRRAAASAERE